jgi:hypothetical protein
MCRYSLLYQSHETAEKRYILEIDVFSLDPLLIRFVNPAQIHDLQIKSILSRKLLVNLILQRKRYLVLGSIHIPNDEVRNIRPQIRLEHRPHLLCMINKHRLPLARRIQ